MSRTQKRGPGIIALLVLTVLVAGGVAAAGLWLGGSRDAPQSAATEARESRRDFRLQDTSGADVTLDTFRGKWLLMFFGFTSCPEACPLAMINAGATLDALGADAAGVQPVFVTVDPERDTAQVLKDYLLNFDTRIAGLGGAPEAVAAMAEAYGVYYRTRPIEGGDYTVDHSTAFYLVAPDGAFQRAFTPNMDPAAFAEEIRAAMDAFRHKGTGAS